MTQDNLREVATHAADFLARAIKAQAEEIVDADSEARTSAELLGKGPPKMTLTLAMTICPDGDVLYRFGYSLKRVVEETSPLSDKVEPVKAKPAEVSADFVEAPKVPHTGGFRFIQLMELAKNGNEAAKADLFTEFGITYP